MNKTLSEVEWKIQKLRRELWLQDQGRVEIEVTPPDVNMYAGLFYSSSGAWLRDANLQA